MSKPNRILYLCFSLFLVAAAGAAPLTGTWITTVTPPPEAGAPPFKLIFTFNEDGTLLATGTGGIAPALGNPCHGGWKSDGDGYSLTYYCLDFDAALQFTGSDKIRGNLTIDGSQRRLSGMLDLTNYDVNDDEVFSACCATVAGDRVQVEKMSPANLERVRRSASRP